MRRLGLVSAVAIVLVAATTAFLVLLGPKPSIPQSSDFLSDAALGDALHEPTDRLVLICWWLVAIGIALSFTWWARHGAGIPVRPKRWYQVLTVTLGVSAVAVVVASVTWGVDPVGMWTGIGPVGLLAGLAFALFVFRFWNYPKWVAATSSIVMVGLLAAYALPALFETPGSVRDSGHFQFTSDELAAVAAGRFPLSDYVPQYTVVLGFPIAPLIRALPDQATWVILLWLLLLQVSSLAISVSMPVLVGGPRILAPASLVAVLPTLIVLSWPTSSATYFATFPLRVILPAASILAAFILLRSRAKLTRRRRAWFALLGALVGLTILNNPDFGAPAGLAILVIMVLAASGRHEAVLSVLHLLAGTAAVFLSYTALGLAVGRPVQWQYWLIFPRIGGVEGWYDVAMGAFGPHVAVVALFVSASVLGFILVRSRGIGSTFQYRQGLLLALVGGWSLMCLPYFAGRSLPPTAVGGYSFQIGMVIAALLPIARATSRALQSNLARFPLESSIALAMSTLAIAGAGATFVFARPPSDYYTHLTSSRGSDFSYFEAQSTALEAILRDPKNIDLTNQVKAGKVQQALSMASLTAIGSGIPSGSITNNSLYFPLSPFFPRMLCMQPWPNDVDMILVPGSVARAMEAEPACITYVDFPRAKSFPFVEEGETSLVLLPAHTAS